MADVVAIPSAAASPVQQQARRGRLPNVVTKLEDARYRRYQRNEAAKKEAFQQGYDLARRESQEVRERMTRITAELASLAVTGDLHALVLAVKARGRPLAMVEIGLDKQESFSMACRLQHRLASMLDEDDEA